MTNVLNETAFDKKQFNTFCFSITYFYQIEWYAKIRNVHSSLMNTRRQGKCI